MSASARPSDSAAPAAPLSIAELDFADHATNPTAFGQALVESLRDTGFAVIRNHTIPNNTIDRMEAASRAFFDMSDAAKSEYAMPDAHYQRGYSPFRTESAKDRDTPDLKEFWHVGRATIPGIPGTPDVNEQPEFNTVSRALFDEMDDFARTLMVAVGETLEMSEAEMRAALVNGNSILRLLHYPPVEDASAIEPGSVRAAAHEDINLLTLLLGAEEAGLEVMHRSGQWLPANPPEGAVVVNAGDMLARLTGGEIPSTTHRVVNPSPERCAHSRYSMPYFLHPANDFVLEALPSCVARGAVAEAPITANGFLNERLREIGLKV